MQWFWLRPAVSGLRFGFTAVSTELAGILGTTAAGPFCRSFRFGAAAVSTELTAVLSAALAGPLFRFRLTAVITELAGIYCATGAGPAAGTVLWRTSLRSAARSLRSTLRLLLTHGV